MKGNYMGIYKIHDFHKGVIDFELLTLNKLGISYYVIYNEEYIKEDELQINISYNINTLVNLNNYILDRVSYGTPRLGLSYYSSQYFYWIIRPYPSIIFDLFEHILTIMKISKKYRIA